MTNARHDHTATLLPDDQVLIVGGNQSGGNLKSSELYNPASDTFTSADDLNHGRYNHVATLLPDGRVMVTGGWGGSALVSTELYEHVPTAPTWTVDAALPTNRSDFAAALLADGRVLVAGGDWGLSYPAEAELYDPALGDWTLTGSLNVTRTRHSLTLLADGRVLVTGGYNSTAGYLTSAELYDPETGTFTPTGSMATARARHTATLMANGWVLVAGGQDSSTHYLTSAEIYNPTTGTWTTADDMNVSRGMHAATLLPDGQVMVAGGWSGSTFRNWIERYDPATDTWTSSAYLTDARRHHTATLLPNGTVLIAGGSGGSGQLDSVEIYDPAGETCTTASGMSSEHNQHSATLLPDGRVLVVGGYPYASSDPTNVVERYDPATDSWETLDNLNVWRAEHVALLLLDGRVLVAGGFRGHGGGYTTTTEIYDPVLTHRTWQVTGHLNAARYDQAATRLTDGRVLLSGGHNSTTPFMTSAELYDPAAGVFSTTGNLSAGRFLHTSALLDDGRVLIAGGLGSGASYLASAELYNPTSGVFLPTTGNLGTGRYQHTATRLPDGQVLIAGGYGGSGRLDSAELYSPTLGTFSATGSLVAARYDHTASTLPDGSVLIAGGYGSSSYLAQSERYDPDNGTFANTTGSMASGRIEHTATALPDGRVLVAGGRDNGATPLTSAELYDPDSGTWSTTGNMSIARYNHTAALLPGGRVLVAGGYNNSGTHLDSAEIYDPATGSWAEVVDLHNARMNHTATALANGRVLVAGGTAGTPLDSAELYVEGRPFLEDATSPLMLGEPLTASGGTFRQRPEASGGDTRSSATNVPLLQLLRLDNAQMHWLPVDPTTPFSDTAFTSLPVEDWPVGYARATVFVNGTPSAARTVQVLAHPGQVTSVAPPANVHTVSVTTSLTITHDGRLDPLSVTTQTLAVHGGFHGKMDGTFSFGSIVFDPTADFVPGELVQATVTPDVMVNGQPISGTLVWQFRTAVLYGSGRFANSGQSLAVPNDTFDVDLGDLDADGDLDAFFANGNAAQPNQVWLNDGTGVLTNSGQNLGTVDSRGAALGDLDGDGDLDAYVANNGPDSIWINQGGTQGSTVGTFALGQSVGLSNTHGVELGDLDADGDLDALTANADQATRVWLNDGTGVFTAHQDLPVAAGTTEAVALGDLDSDGDLDAVEANYMSPQAIYLNDGSGTFTPHPNPAPISAGDPTRDVEMGDLDGDGDLDLFVVEQYGWTIPYKDSIWLNDGTGRFVVHQQLDNEYSHGGALGDLDGDGDLDAWIANYYDQPATIWLNDGTGTMARVQSTDNADSHAVSLGDLDADGDLDALVANKDGQPNTVWFNLKQGQVTNVAPAANTHTAPLTTNLTVTTDVAVDSGSVTTQTLAVHGGFHGRMDGAFSFGSVIFDPTQDLHPGELVRTTVSIGVTANGLPLKAPFVWQFRTAVDAGLGWFVDSGQTLSASSSRRGLLGDLDGDGDLDVFVANYNNSETDSVWLNDGSGTYIRLWTNSGSVRYTYDAALGDLDGDGDLDVYQASSWQADRILLNNGDGTFSHHQYVGSDWGTGVALGDLDADGDLDAFVSNSTDQANRVWLNDGTGTMSSSQGTGSAKSTDVALGDLDADGDLDAFVANANEPNEVWLNNGDGTYADSGQTLGSAESWGVALGDVDGDGDLDAYVANDGEPNTIWFNDGAGNFTDSGQTLGSLRSRHVQLGDVDGDGDLDAFVANYSSQSIEGWNQVWLNDGSATFSASDQEIAPRMEGSGVSLGDVDGDGDLDAFIANSGSHPDLVWFNQNEADLSISKAVVPAVIAPGDTVTYTVVYTNTGPEAASGVVITDRVPVTLTNVHYDATSAVTPSGTFSYTWEVGPLGVGEGGTITVTGVVSTGVTGVFSLTNEAVITSALVLDADVDDNRSLVSNTVEAVPPEMLAASPSAGATDVALTASVVITFSEAIDAGSFAYSVAPDPGGWAEAWNGENTVVTLTHAYFAGGTVYTVTVTAADDRVGNPLVGAPVVWSFTTTDVAAPLVLAVSPEDKAVEVALTAPVVITFSEAIDVGSFAYSVTPDPGGWAEAWNGDDTAVSLTHADFAGGTVYTVTITAADDLTGNPLVGAPVVWSFATADVAAPSVLAVSPALDAQDVALTAPVVITFSEAIDVGSFAYSVTPDPGGWAEAWNGDDTAVSLTHADFTGDTVYTVSVTAADDLVGNPLVGAPYAWLFTTTAHTIYLPVVTKGG